MRPPSPIPGFYAYPSHPINTEEAIQVAVAKINEVISNVHIETWRGLSINGRELFEPIGEAIAKCKLLCIDLTGLNLNVLFEMGYGAAKKKRLWLTYDTQNLDLRADFERFKAFTTLGYQPAWNSNQIEAAYFNDMPHESLDKTLYKDQIEQFMAQTGRPHLFYLKQNKPMQASIQLTNKLDMLRPKPVIFDPEESTARSLSWCADMTAGAYGVVCHFMDPRRVDARLLNCRYSFVAGMAHGLGLPLLLLGDEQFQPPLDYRDLFKTYKNSAECLKYFEEWHAALVAEQKAGEISRKNYALSAGKAAGLRALDLGDYVAEQDKISLENSFVPTAEYVAAQRGSNRIFVGRKGSGKSANLYMLSSDLELDSDALVCVIKPPDYELETLVHLLSMVKTYAQGYVSQALWKYLLVTELSIAAAKQISMKAEVHYSDAEKGIMQIYNDPSGSLQVDFAVRLERALRSIENVLPGVKDAHIEEIRSKVSEALYKYWFTKLSKDLGRYLGSRKRVGIFVDNLDKSWDKSEDLKDLSHFIFGLLSIADDLPAELIDRVPIKQRPAMFFAIFLRSDIFAKVLDHAKEKDKLKGRPMNWNDRELLLRVAEYRFFASDKKLTDPSKVWAKYFVSEMNGLPVKEYILSSILPRPRDLLVFINAALENAINRGHSIIEQADLASAAKSYGEFAFESLTVESTLRGISLEEGILSLLQSEPELSYKDLISKMKEVGIPRKDVEPIVDELCSLSFLGPQMPSGEFQFVESPKDYKNIQLILNKVSRGDRSRNRYKINPVFNTFLGIRSAAHV